MKKILLSSIIGTSLLFGAYSDVGTDYEKAIVQEYTEEDALESLNIVNDVLKFLKDSRVDKFVNKGNYISLVKDRENGGGASSGSGTSTTTEKLLPLTLNVTRDTNTSATTNPPMNIEMWFDIPDGPNDKQMRIIGYFNITHSVDTEYPLGKLRLDFNGYGINADGTTKTADKMLQAVMELDKARGTDGNVSGRADVKMILKMSEDGGTTWGTPQVLNMTYDVSVQKDINGDGVIDEKDQGRGVAYTIAQIHDGDNDSYKAYELAFSNTIYLTQEVNTAAPLVDRNDTATGKSIKSYAIIDGAATCKSKENFDYKVYQYGLFDASTGDKIKHNSGFPIKKGSGATTVHGYIGYWGLWSEGDAIKDGDTVKKDDGTTPTSYTISQTKGKLIKYTKATAAMDEITGTDIFVWTYRGSDMGTQGQYVVYWDGTELKIKGKQTCNDNGCDINNTYSGYTADISDLNISDWTTGWSESLSANIPIKGVSDSTPIAYHSQKVIVPDDNLTLINFGYEIINPDMNLSNAAVLATSEVNESIRYEQNNTVIGNVYLYSVNDGVLVDVNRSNKPVIIPADTNWSHSTHNWWQYGAQMGPLLSNDANTTDSNASTYNASNFWQVEQNATTFYKWEVGTNNWNKATVLKDSNNHTVSFSPPIDIKYTHTTANDYDNNDTYDGKMFMIHYDGNNLGLPWKYIEGKGWMPIISIKSGTVIGNSSEYVLKAIGIGAIPEEISCDNAGVDINPSKDVNGSFVPVSWDNNTSLLDLNLSVVGTTISTTKPTDANVSVVKGVLVGE